MRIVSASKIVTGNQLCVCATKGRRRLNACDQTASTTHTHTRARAGAHIQTLDSCAYVCVRCDCIHSTRAIKPWIVLAVVRASACLCAWVCEHWYCCMQEQQPTNNNPKHGQERIFRERVIRCNDSRVAPMYRCVRFVCVGVRVGESPICAVVFGSAVECVFSRLTSQVDARCSMWISQTTVPAATPPMRECGIHIHTYVKHRNCINTLSVHTHARRCWYIHMYMYTHDRLYTYVQMDTCYAGTVLGETGALDSWLLLFGKL